MRALDPLLLSAGSALCGLFAGLAGAKAADVLPGRAGITHSSSGSLRSRRRALLVLLSALCWFGIATVLATVKELSPAHGALLLVTNGIAATSVLAAAAIDLEHMILPNELTLAPAVLCLATSPFRSVGVLSSVAGALAGLAIAWLPLLLYRRVRRQNGMGLGDAKLAFMAGAWHGILGVPFVLFLGAAQSALAAGVLRLFGLGWPVPASVQAEIAEQRARASAGDEEARKNLEADPMAGDVDDGMLTMRLPFGPFLALACIEVLFLRRWLIENVVGWLMR